MTQSAAALLPDTIAEATRRLTTGELSSVTLVEGFLERIAAANQDLAAYVTVAADQAIEHARLLDAERANGRLRGPLHGIPYAAKDTYATADLLTTAHSRHLLHNVPERDATCIARLDAAGAILLGKLAAHEFGFGGPADDLPFPPARNPWDPSRVPGGSSSGSAVAVAAGLCLGALASDSGGSIRAPAAYCGVVGLKPTFGLVSRAGVVRLSDSLDHCGPMARTVADCSLIYETIAAPDPADPATLVQHPRKRAAAVTMHGMRVGVLRDLETWMPDLSVAQRASQSDAQEIFKELGADLIEVEIPDLDVALAASRAILFGEAFATHADRLRKSAGTYSQITRERLMMGMFVELSDYLAAKSAQPGIARAVDDLLKNIDILALPAASRIAGRFADRDPSPFLAGVDVSNVFNLTGHPFLVVPCGLSEGMPLGLELVGARNDEATLFAAGGAFEQVTPWSTQRPPNHRTAERGIS